MYDGTVVSTRLIDSDDGEAVEVTYSNAADTQYWSEAWTVPACRVALDDDTLTSEETEAGVLRLAVRKYLDRTKSRRLK